jgi:hypothetical protein
MLSMDMESPQTSPPPPPSSFGPSDGGAGGLERSAVPGRLSGSFKGTEAWDFFDSRDKLGELSNCLFLRLVNAGTRIETKMFFFAFSRKSFLHLRENT